MKGIILSERYFFEICAPMIEEKFPDYRKKIAAGLVGDGSECFGFDDEISQDHDWGPAFCLWLTKDDYGAIGKSLQNEVNKLPQEFAGIKARQEGPWGAGRTGVFKIGEFYKRFIGFDHVPESFREWQAVPEENYSYHYYNHPERKAHQAWLMRVARYSLSPGVAGHRGRDPRLSGAYSMRANSP